MCKVAGSAETLHKGQAAWQGHGRLAGNHIEDQEDVARRRCRVGFPIACEGPLLVKEVVATGRKGRGVEGIPDPLPHQLPLDQGYPSPTAGLQAS